MHPINVRNIRLLDVVEIPIIAKNRSSYEQENYAYNSEKNWQFKYTADIVKVLKFIEYQLLHPQFQKSIPADYFYQQTPVASLQLIKVKHLECIRKGRFKWRAIIHDPNYQLAHEELSITDPMICEQLDRHGVISPHCLLIMSFSQPWRSSEFDELKCYRLVAVIIELPPDLDQILQEMKRLGWQKNQGRHHLQENFDKVSRYQLTIDKCQQFLDYLKSQPSL